MAPDLRNDDDPKEKRREALLVTRMGCSLALTALGIVLTLFNPGGDGPIVGCVGVIAALCICRQRPKEAAREGNVDIVVLSEP
jgi:hypothetical protein